MSEVWNRIHNIRGREKRPLRALVEGGITYATEQGIADKLSETFADISSSRNYLLEFRSEKMLAERVDIYVGHDDEHYNGDFTLEELRMALTKLKPNAAPGSHIIHNKMLLNLPESAVHHLLLVYN